MAAIVTEFKLDFQVHVRKQDLPTYQSASAAYANTVPNAPIGIEFRQQKPGVFIVKTFNEKDAKKIENAALTYYYGVNLKNQCKVKFSKMPKFVFYSNPKWLTVDWVQDSGLRYATNDDFDEFFSGYGDIIVKTHDDKNELGMLNGRKKCRIDLNKGLEIERVKMMEMDVVTESGEKRCARAKIKFYYAGQPAFCRDCHIDHIGKCPEKIKLEEKQKEYAQARKSKVDTLLIGDSNLRHVNESATFADTNGASGAKIGHIANVIEQVQVGKYKNLIIHAGGNNVMPEADIHMDKWNKQVQSEVAKLSGALNKLAQNGTAIKIVSVPKTPATQVTKKTVKMRDTLNRELEAMVTKLNEGDGVSEAEMIKLADEEEATEGQYEDAKHYSQQRCATILEEIHNSMAKAGKSLIDVKRPMYIPLTVEKIYSGIYSTYRFGCPTCTIIGHSEDKCLLGLSQNKHRLSSDEDSSNLSKKR